MPTHCAKSYGSKHEQSIFYFLKIKKLKLLVSADVRSKLRWQESKQARGIL